MRAVARDAKPAVITIDGPAGAGKSTVARRLAERLGYRVVPTGAMYRAVTLSLTRAGLPAREGPALRAHLEGVSVSVKDERVFLGAEDVTDAIRTAEIDQATSSFTMFRAVRERMTPLQRRLAEEGGVVLEGRDTGTVVCPDAPVKFFLTASPEARARRRHAELAATGTVRPLEAVRAEVLARDAQDQTRDLAPLRKAADAIEVDTSNLTVDQVVERMLEEVGRKCSTRC